MTKRNLLRLLFVLKLTMDSRILLLLRYDPNLKKMGLKKISIAILVIVIRANLLDKYLEWWTKNAVAFNIVGIVSILTRLRTSTPWKNIRVTVSTIGHTVTTWSIKLSMSDEA